LSLMQAKAKTERCIARCRLIVWSC
jgi:hypothetical protein